ncbi:MAG: succinate dehydrogenase, cytochrome b556 subunit [Rhodospirillales bacterium]|jgi:succinate dehydrogenase / fumarate reductase, cytochrome b subunit|nr:succinate dehydrogenase, cytochrome b556 subunit [Rhodospirillales bacterium]
MSSAKRPLSPHLLIYKHQATSSFSILHRICGVAMTFGTILFAYWFTSAAYGPEAFETAQSIMGSWFGLLVLFGFTFSFFFHLATGIRYICWDMVLGFDMEVATRNAAVITLFALSMTALTWYVGCSRMGDL